MYTPCFLGIVWNIMTKMVIVDREFFECTGTDHGMTPVFERSTKIFIITKKKIITYRRVRLSKLMIITLVIGNNNWYGHHFIKSTQHKVNWLMNWWTLLIHIKIPYPDNETLKNGRKKRQKLYHAAKEWFVFLKWTTLWGHNSTAHSSWSYSS